MYTKRNKTAATIVLILTIVASLFSSSGFAHAGYNSYASATAQSKAVAKDLMGVMIGMGFSAEAAAGVVGNVNQESAFEYDMIERNSGYFKPLLESDPCKITRAENTGAVGLFQLDGSRRTDQFCGMHKAGLKWTDYKGQIQFTLGQDIKNEDPFKVSAYVNRINSKYCGLASGVDCSAAANIKSFEDFKKLKDPAVAAIAWAAVWERCAWNSLGNIPLRVKFARETFEALKGTPGVSGAVSGGGSSAAPVGVPVGTGTVGKPKNENELTGMPSQAPSFGGTPEKGMSISDMTVAEQYSVAQIHEDVKNATSGAVHYLQMLISLIGLASILYGVLLLVAMAFDRANTIFEFSLLKIMTWGKFKLADSPEEVDKHNLTSYQIVARVFISVATGLSLISGTLLGWTTEFLLFMSSKGML